MKKYCVFILILQLVLTQCQSTINRNTALNEPPKVKNVIIMIGDGMGVSQVYAGITANKGVLNMEQCQYVGLSKTYSASNYITDSAAGGTAIACGIKTKNGAIGVDTTGSPAKSLLEYGIGKGLSTGIVVSCDLTHATPASFIAHQPNRDMADEIALDYAHSGITLCIGGGRDHFEKRADEQNLTDKMKAAGYQVVYSMEEANAITSGKLVGLMADGHPEPYPERGNLLPDGVKKAIELLSKNEDGFILMVEGSQIDWAGHSNDPDYLINEMLDFDRAIKVAFDFAKQDPNTLVIITADHETGGLALNGGSFETGEIEAAYSTKGHTGVMVPVFAFGNGAENFAGIYENTDILNKILGLYGIN